MAAQCTHRLPGNRRLFKHDGESHGVVDGLHVAFRRLSARRAELELASHIPQAYHHRNALRHPRMGSQPHLGLELGPEHCWHQNTISSISPNQETLRAGRSYSSRYRSSTSTKEPFFQFPIATGSANFTSYDLNASGDMRPIGYVAARIYAEGRDSE